MTLGIPILISVVVCTIVQLYFWAYSFKRISKAREYGPSNSSEGVSVLICAHNEADNLLRNLPDILSQVYPLFEVVVVNHGSSDETQHVLEKLKKEYDKLRSIYQPFVAVGKRPALQAGLTACRFDRILLTDADCSPSSRQWIAYMTAPFDQRAEVILGPAPLRGAESLLGVVCRFNAALTYLQYADANLRGSSFMGVGRNMAYYRTAPIANHSQNFTKYIGGDDDQLIASMRKESIRLVTSEKAAMWSPTPSSWRDFFRQKRRHVSVSWQYRRKDQLLLFVFAITHWGHLFGLLILLFTGFSLTVMFILYLVRAWAVIHTLSHQAFIFTQELNIADRLVGDFFNLLQYPLIALFLFTKPPSKW